MALDPAFLRAPIAHRALHDKADGRPENSLAAIAAACAAGYGIEIDLQLTRDGEAAVFHDHKLERLTGVAGLTRDLTMADLADLRLLDTAEPVPSLSDALALVAGRVPLLIELKHQFGLVGQLERAVARDLETYEGPVAVMSFDPRLIAEMARIAPGIARGLTTQAADTPGWPDDLDAQARTHLGEIADFDAVGASFISHDRMTLDSAPVARIKARGVPVLCWTIRSPEQEARAREVADNVTFEGYLPPVSAD